MSSAAAAAQQQAAAAAAAQQQQKQQQQQQGAQRQQVQPALAESIQTIIAQLGMPPLQPDCAITMAPSVEYHLREVIQEASKFMRHSKRTTLLTRDVNNALRSMGIEQLFGFSSSDPLRFVKHERPGIFTVHDPLLSLSAVVNQPLPACPVEPSLGAHWMSIEGVQPAIPENPQAKASGPAAGGAAAGAAAQGGAEGAKPIKSEDSEVVPRVKHVLSRELQLYHDSVTDAITQGTRVQQDAALKSLASDAGYQELVPYLTLFVSDTVTHSLRNLDLLHVLMRAVYSLLTNPHVGLAPYIHQLIPAILTCVVGKRLCAEPLENHWKLRDYAAELVALVCEKFGPSYDTLQPRITKTLLGAFVNPARPRTTHYGAIVALTKLGPHTIHNLVLPNLKDYITTLEDTMAELAPDASAEERVRRLEATKCYSALLNCAGEYIHRYWSLYSDSHPTAKPGQQGGAARVAPASHGKRKSVLSNYSLPGSKKSKTDGEGGGAGAKEGEAAEAKKPGGGAAAASAVGSSGGGQLPAPALPYSELYAIFGDKLQPFLPPAGAAPAAVAGVADTPAL